MSCAQTQAEAVSLVKKASLLLKIYIRPVVAETFLLFNSEVISHGSSSSVTITIGMTPFIFG